MKKMLFALLTLSALVLPSGFCADADDSTGASTEVEGAAARRDFMADLRAARAFQGASPELQQAMLRIARFAAEYASMREQDILDLPGEREVEVRGAGSGWEGVGVRVKQADNTNWEFSYDRKLQRVNSVCRINADKSRISVYNHTLKATAAMTSGSVSLEGGNRHFDFTFDDSGTGQIKPRTALSLVGPGWPDVMVRGKVVYWDKQGNAVVDLDVSDPRNPLVLYNEVYPTLTEEQLDALEITARERLVASKAFQGAELELQRTMENMVGSAERFIGAKPNDLNDLLVGVLHGKEIKRIDHEQTIEYCAPVDGTDWTFVYDRERGRLRSFTRSGLAVYFDYLDTERIIGGRGVLNRGERYWLVTFYPGKCAPRTAIAALGPALLGQTPLNLLAEGNVYVWNPAGKLLVKKKIATLKPISEVMEDIQAALTAEQKAVVTWRGEKELAWLFDAIKISPKDRLMSSNAYRYVEPGLQRTIEDIVVQSGRFIRAKPTDLAALLGVKELKQIDQDQTIEYQALDPSGGNWTFVYDRALGRLRSAKKDDALAIYFDYSDPEKIAIVGHGVFDDGGERRQGLISFHPGAYALRTAFSARVHAGRPPPDNLRISGVYVFGPAGELLQESHRGGSPLSSVVEDLEARLTEEQKAAINWRGEKETDYLLGKF